MPPYRVLSCVGCSHGWLYSASVADSAADLASSRARNDTLFSFLLGIVARPIAGFAAAGEMVVRYSRYGKRLNGEKID